MSDQAQKLRNLMDKLEEGDQQLESPKAERNTRVITVTSGKGGVGKANFTLNFALALQKRGKQVLIFDADIGLANIDVLKGVHAEFNLYHLLKKEKTIWEIIATGQHGLRFIAGGSGFTDLLRLTDDELNNFAEQVSLLNGHVDYIIFDTGAGLSKETLKFILAAHETLVVTTPEPTSITDAYAIIKMVHKEEPGIAFRLIINRVTDQQEGKQTADKISLVAKKFLDLEIPLLGYVADDDSVSRSVKRQIPFSVAYPDCSAARDVQQIADRFLGEEQETEVSTQGIRSFLRKILRFAK